MAKIKGIRKQNLKGKEKSTENYVKNKSQRNRMSQH